MHVSAATTSSRPSKSGQVATRNPMKLNTVVSKPNLNDDMTELVLELRPERWKIFEVLPVEGQNDGDVDDLLLDEGEVRYMG